MPKKIELGSIVTWKSQANGTTIGKRGIVVEVVLPNQVPKSMATGVRPRSHESYVVEVTRKGRKPERYYPLVAKLRVTTAGQPKVDASIEQPMEGMDAMDAMTEQTS